MKLYLKSIKKYILLSLIFFMLETVVTSIILFLPGYLLDNFSRGKQFVLELTGIYIIFFIMYLCIAYISNRLADFRRVKFERKIKNDFFKSVINRDYQEFSKYKIGEYISMQSNDITEMCQNYLSPLIGIYRSTIMISVFGLSLMYFVNGFVAVLIILFSGIAVFLPNITEKELAKRNSFYLKQVGNYTEQITNFFNAYEIFDKKSKQRINEVQVKEQEKVFTSNMQFRKLNSLAMVINGGSVELVQVITFFIIAVLLVNGSITVGMATTAFMYSGKFNEPLYEFSLNMTRIKSVKEVQKKLLEILRDEPIVDKNQVQLEQFDHIQCNHVEKYFDTKTIALPDLLFESGKKYLILGDNGVGKSVLFKLLMNYYSLDKGDITYDGIAIDKIDLDYLNCYVSQTPYIFDTDYYNNVTLYGTYKTDQLDYYEQFFPVHMIEKIKSSTNLKNLSGGEKQIIALLRALITNKEVLLLDEPFSAMNKVTISHFMNHLHQISSTIIIIAHNLDEYIEAFNEVYTIYEIKRS